MQLIYKSSGLTMNQFIQLIQEQNKWRKIAYAGRLDPMARGWVPILFDSECYNMTEYTNMKKIYQVRVVVGISTDSDDTLGIIQHINTTPCDLDKLKEMFTQSNTTINQSFHYYSTKQINKRRKNDTSDTKHIVELIKSVVIESGNMDTKEWINNIITTIDKIDKTRDFRQSKTIEQWEKIALQHNTLQYIDLELTVSSGFFVRQFIRDMIELANIPLLCHDIHRISIY